jgi:hypothetical protein
MVMTTGALAGYWNVNGMHVVEVGVLPQTLNQDWVGLGKPHTVYVYCPGGAQCAIVQLTREAPQKILPWVA